MEQKMRDYLDAGKEEREPAWVPTKILLLNAIVSPPFIQPQVIAHPGEYETSCNRLGAISVMNEDKKLIGIKPGEYAVIKWGRNPYNRRSCEAEIVERWLDEYEESFDPQYICILSVGHIRGWVSNKGEK